MRRWLLILSLLTALVVAALIIPSMLRPGTSPRPTTQPASALEDPASTLPELPSSGNTATDGSPGAPGVADRSASRAPNADALEAPPTPTDGSGRLAVPDAGARRAPGSTGERDGQSTRRAASPTSRSAPASPRGAAGTQSARSGNFAPAASPKSSPLPASSASPGVSGPMAAPGGDAALPAETESAQTPAGTQPDSASEPQPSNEPTSDDAIDADRGATEDAESKRPASPAAVWLTPTDVAVAVGAVFEIGVQLDRGDDLASVPFHLVFDPAVLAFAGADEGSLLASDGQSTVFMATSSPGSGRVVVGLSRLGPVGGVTGNGSLCRLRFEAVGAGTSPLIFERESVIQSGGGAQSATFDGGRVTVR